MAEPIIPAAAPAVPATPVTPAPAAPVTPVTPAPVVKDPVTPEVKPPAAEAKPVEKDTTLLGQEPETPQQKAEADKAAAEAKAEALKNETPDQKAAREKAEAEAAKEGNVVPDKYVVKAPEGTTIDQGMLDKLAPVLKEQGITQAGFQKIVDAYAPLLQDQQKQAIAAQQTEAIKMWKEQVNGWGDETKTMLGPKSAEELAHAARAINKLSSDPKALRALMGDKETGVGNHKLMVEFFIRAGKLLGEDKFVEGSRTAGAQGGVDAKKMFPTATA